MSFKVFYKIENNKLMNVGLEGFEGAKKVRFDSYESAVIFEDKLIRMKASNTKVNNKMIKELSKGG